MEGSASKPCTIVDTPAYGQRGNLKGTALVVYADVKHLGSSLRCDGPPVSIHVYNACDGVLTQVHGRAHLFDSNYSPWEWCFWATPYG